MLVSNEDLQQFNSLVKPFEEEAYDILKRRSREIENTDSITSSIRLCALKLINGVVHISSPADRVFLQDGHLLCALPKQATPPSATSSHLYQVSMRNR